MPDLLKSIANAPAIDVFVIVGAVLVIFAAVGRALWSDKRNPKMDTPGRVLCGGCGVALLGGALVMFLKMQDVAGTPPTDLSEGHGGKTAAPVSPILTLAPPPSTASEAPVAPAPSGGSSKEIAGKAAAKLAHEPSAPPAAKATPSVVMPPAMTRTEAPRKKTTIESSSYPVSWGCAEEKVFPLSLPLPPGTRFLSAEVEVRGLEKARSFRKFQPVYDPNTRTVTASVSFRGLDKVFFNCPGDGRATVRLKAEVAEP